MVSEQTFDIMLEHLSKNPEDWVLRLMMADWCEENGLLDRAECLRWMAENQKRAMWTKGGVEWFNGAYYDKSKRDPESNLPETLFMCLVDGSTKAVEYYRRYSSTEESELAVYGAWVRAKQKEWRPEDGD